MPLMTSCNPCSIRGSLVKIILTIVFVTYSDPSVIHSSTYCVLHIRITTFIFTIIVNFVLMGFLNTVVAVIPPMADYRAMCSDIQY